MTVVLISHWKRRSLTHECHVYLPSSPDNSTKNIPESYLKENV